MNANPLVLAAVPHHGLVQLADLDENKVTPGLLGFVVFAVIGGATWFLMRNMNKQLQKIDFEPALKVSTPTPATASAKPTAPSVVEEPTSPGSAESKP